MKKNKKKQYQMTMLIALLVLFGSCLALLVFVIIKEHNEIYKYEDMNVVLREAVVHNVDTDNIIANDNFDDVIDMTVSDIDAVITDDNSDVSADHNVVQSYSNIDENMYRTVDFDYLFNLNSDIYMWLYVPNTNIDYPVLQEPVYNEYFYLNHNYKKDYTINGSCFTPKSPYDMDDAHMLIFGHNMKDKSVAFGQLVRKYKTYDYAVCHPYIYKYYPDRVERWTLWCAVDSTSDDIVYNIPFSIGSDRYGELLNSIDAKTKYKLCDKPSVDTYTTILTTCNKVTVSQDIRFYLVYIPDAVRYY